MTKGVLRALVIAPGVAVWVWSIAAFRLADWPCYLLYAALSTVFFRLYVRVLPDLVLPVPGLTLTIAFLYLAGPPIIALRLAEPIIALVVRAMLPAASRRWVRAPIGGAGAVASFFWIKDADDRFAAAAEWANFSLGLAVRWWIVSLVAPGAEPASSPAVVALAELGGYASWAILSTLPIYFFRPIIPLVPGRLGGRVEEPKIAARTVLHDLGVIFVMTLTPFVFLILYGYRAHGLTGAAVWSLAAVGLHFMLKLLTERRVVVEEQNRRLEALNRELEHRERLSAIGKMSSVISHQMLQQLGVIGIYADLIRHADPAADGGAARVHAAAIEDALAGINRVLTDLLVFSRDLRLNLYEHRLADVLAESVEDGRPLAAERGVTLRLECAPDTSARLDKLKIKQAVGNVLRNAIEASPPAGAVLIHCRRADGTAEIAITDHGAGIPDAHRTDVFTPFFTTKEHGTGLGLAIAREFVEAHRGTITAEMRNGGGATFVIRLPCAGPPEA